MTTPRPPRPASRLAWAAQLFAAMHASRMEREKAQKPTPSNTAS